MNFRRMTLLSIFLLVCLVPLFYAYKYFYYVSENSDIKHPNVLLITVDTCQYGVVGAYGNAEVYTPFMDRLAREGVLFPRGYAPVPTTGPSHASILTGRSPCTHRVFRNAMKYDDSYVTLSKLLNDSGYRTAAFVSGYSLTARTCGLDTGFDYYDDKWSEKKLERSATEAVDSCINWLKENRGDRFFVWLHLFDPHTPYLSQEPFHEMLKLSKTGNHPADSSYTEDQKSRYEKNVNNAIAKSDFMVLTKHPMATDTDDETLRSNWEKYMSEVSYTDSELDRLRRFLRKSSLWKNTLVSLTADHGEGFDHDYFYAHGDRLWESAVRVPWLLKTPKNKTLNRIARFAARHEDIFPTIKAFCNIGLPIIGLEGSNLKDAIENERIGGMPSWMVIAPELPRKNISQGTIIAAYEPNFKLIQVVETEEEMLFLLNQDPGELIDVSDRFPRVAERLSKRLEKTRRFCRIPGASHLTHQEVDQADQLKALGYIQ